MPIYELRTCGVIVGKMSEVQQLYQSQGWPAQANKLLLAAPRGPHP